MNNYRQDLTSDLQDLSLTNLQKYRLLTRLGSSAVMITGYLLGIGGPVGMIASAGIGILGEVIMNKTVEEQKQVIEQELDKKIDLCLNQYCQKIAERLQNIYQQIMQEIKQEQKTWKQNQQILVEKINSINTEEEVKKWTELINQINDLETIILSTIKN